MKIKRKNVCYYLLPWLVGLHKHGGFSVRVSVRDEEIECG